MPRIYTSRSPYERMIEKAIAGPNACIVFVGWGTKAGHGRVSGQGGAPYKGAHVVSFEHWHGPAAPGLFVLHRCDNPPCVNPHHLYTGTQADNGRDMSERGRTHGHQISHCPADHAYDDANTLRGADGKRRCRTCRNQRSRAAYAAR